MKISLIDKVSFIIKGKQLTCGLGPLNNSLLDSRANIIITSQQEGQEFIGKKDNKAFIINAPGEYEISGVSVFGIKDIYIIEIDDIRIGYLSKLNAELTDRQLEEIDGVDLLIVPVGDDYVDLGLAVKTVSQVQPKILICNHDIKISDFSKELGFDNIKKENKLIVSKANLPEEMEVVTLNS